MEFLLYYGCNLFVRILKYEENIVFFVCIGESCDVCKFVGCNKDMVELLYVINSMGLNLI